MRFEQFKINLVEAILDEAEMTPKAFQEFLNSPLVTGMRMGFELEACIHNVRSINDDYSENDYSYDERVLDIEDIINFFGNEDANRESDLSKLRNDLYEDFQEWQDEKFDNYLKTDDGQTDLKELIRSNLEDLDYDDRQQKLEFAKAEEGQVSDVYAEAEMKALETMRDEFNDDGDNDFEAFAKDIDMSYMSDVENKYSHYLYWPYQSYDDEEYLNTDYVADELYTDTGIEAWASDSYHGTSRGRAQEQGKWIIEPDSSIEVDDSEDGGYNEDSYFDRFYGKQFFLDANASYAFTKKLRFFAEANNLTNQPLRYYQGIEARTAQLEYYGPRYNTGLKLDLTK